MPQNRTALPAAVVRRGTIRLLVVRDHNERALAYVYFEDEPGRRSAAKLLTERHLSRSCSSWYAP
jgi:hypothetical protein